MAGFETKTNVHLIRDDVWSKQLKSLLLDDLMAMRYVRIITDFPDGTEIHIPSIGEAETADFAEGAAIKYNKLDTGDFVFSFDQYKYSAHSISEKFKRDSYYASDVIASFVPRQHRALMEAVETRILSRGNSSQTPGDLNNINGRAHRYIGSGTGERMTPQDFARARLSLQAANVPNTNLVAIVDPSVTYSLMTQTNIVNLLSPMQHAESIIKDGMTTGMRFRFNIYGVDVYESNYLPRNIAETIGALTTTVGVANYIFSAAAGDILPFIGGFRQTPTVYTEFNKDLQQTEYLTIAEYGFKIYRPENLVTIITDVDVV